MKISELSERTGVPVPSIKFYIREGLLSPGNRTARNQAEYGAGHLERLTLIRTLREDAGLGIEAIARALRAADTAKADFVVAAIDALSRPPAVTVDPSSDAARRALTHVLSLVQARAWDLDARDVSVQEAARALAVVERSFPVESAESLAPYADAAECMANVEIPEGWAPDEAKDAALRYAVLGTVLFEPLILALRRMAHVARARRFGMSRKARGRA